jgi:hypothetical protein
MRTSLAAGDYFMIEAAKGKGIFYFRLFWGKFDEPEISDEGSQLVAWSLPRVRTE